MRDDGLVNRGRDVFAAGAFVDKRLNVCLCENSAARGDRINRSGAGRKLIQSARVGFQERGHLVDEGSCSAGASSVHALLHAAFKVSDFGVLAAKLDDDVGLRDYLSDGGCGRDDFLYKGNIEPLAYG